MWHTVRTDATSSFKNRKIFEHMLLNGRATADRLTVEGIFQLKSRIAQICHKPSMFDR
jgi:hypothetical protein